MQNHIKMTKSFLQLLTKLESSIDTSNSFESARDRGSDDLDVEINTEKEEELEQDTGNTGSDVKGSINITCNDIDNIYIQLTHKDELINKLKDIIVCKNDKITALIKDINDVKQRNDYLESKIIELTKTIKLLHENIDRNTLIIDNK
jgi:hypothetical protein